MKFCDIVNYKENREVLISKWGFTPVTHWGPRALVTYVGTSSIVISNDGQATLFQDDGDGISPQAIDLIIKLWEAGLLQLPQML